MNDPMSRGVWFGTLIGLCLVIAVQLFGADTLRDGLRYYSFKLERLTAIGMPRFIHDWMS
jgi:hypothetical protein